MNRSSRILSLLAASIAAALLACPPAQAQERITYKVIGQPLATGLIQKNKEQPFFEESPSAPACRSRSTTSRSTRSASRTPSSCAS